MFMMSVEATYALCMHVCTLVVWYHHLCSPPLWEQDIYCQFLVIDSLHELHYASEVVVEYSIGKHFTREQVDLEDAKQSILGVGSLWVMHPFKKTLREMDYESPINLFSCNREMEST